MNTPWVKFRKYVWFWGDQKMFYNGSLCEMDIFSCGAKLRPFMCKIILQKYTSLWIGLTQCFSFTVFLGMAQIFTDFPTGSKQKWQKSHGYLIYLLGSIFLQYYFCGKCLLYFYASKLCFLIDQWKKTLFRVEHYLLKVFCNGNRTW